MASEVNHQTVLFRNKLYPIPLTEREIEILAILNAELKLNLKPGHQGTLNGVKFIGKEVFRQRFSHKKFIELGVSLRSFGVIYLKLQGTRCRVDPLGSFGIKELLFG